jgi:signal transduction histidine kinase
VSRSGQGQLELSPIWLRLFVSSRLGAGAVAVVLLVAHRVTAYDGILILLGGGYVLATAALAQWRPGVVGSPWLWVPDTLAVLALVAASSDWRSPFYLLALTTLVAPAAALQPRAALALGAAYSGVYAALGHFIGPDPLGLGTQASVETLATHLVLPIFATAAVSYGAETVRRLREERRRSERLAVEAERRRIAWELHDSAKQRIHVAHLLLSSIAGTINGDQAPVVKQLLHELEAAGADMDTSLAELQSPLGSQPLDDALRRRAAEMRFPGGPQIVIEGVAPDLAPLAAAHAFRVASEALTNAARHAGATRVDVTLERHDGEVVVSVTDDGIGMPESPRPGATGLRAMRNRARTIGGTVRFTTGRDGKGTRVELRVPATTQGDRK